MISLRQGEILKHLVKEYIDLAKPISSQLLERKYGFGVSPAMIRIEMQRLDDQGYIFQPHTSAGRIPTDTGYRYFVNTVLDDQVELTDFSLLQEIVNQKNDNIFEWISDLTDTISNMCSGLALGHIEGDDFLSKHGWKKILKEPEFENRKAILDFTDFLQSFEKDFQELDLDSDLQVFIGQESPFEKSEDFSIIVSKCNFPEKGTISILGPKRMVYDQNIYLINFLLKLI